MLSRSNRDDYKDSRKYFIAADDYKDSRKYFIAADASAKIAAQLSGGTFLAALLGCIGVSDGSIGTIISLGALGALFQLFTVRKIRSLKYPKRFICFCASQRMWLGIIYFIPFLFFNDGVKKVIIVTFLLLEQIISQQADPLSVDWIASIVPVHSRGKYFSHKDSICIALIVTSMFGMGVVFDFSKKTDIRIGFFAMGLVLLLLTILNVAAFLKMTYPELKPEESPTEEKRHISNTIKERDSHTVFFSQLKSSIHFYGFKKALVANMLWTVSFYISSPFNASYQIKELGLSYSYIMAWSFVTTAIRVYLMPRMGKRADRSGNEKMLALSLSFLALYDFIMILMVPGNCRWLFPVSAVLSSLGWSYIGTGLLNLQLNCLNKDDRVMQYTLISAGCGLMGFFVSFAGGIILRYLQNADISLLGEKIYAQQFMNAFGFIGILLLVFYLYIHFWRKQT